MAIKSLTKSVSLTGGAYTNTELVNGNLVLTKGTPTISNTDFIPSFISIADATNKGWTITSYPVSPSRHMPFDGTTSAMTLNSSTSWPYSLEINSGNTVKKKLGRYTIMGSVLANKDLNPAAWVLMGYKSDGSGWVQLDSRSGITWTAAYEVKTFDISLGNYIECTAWRFEQFNNNSASYAIPFVEFDLFEVTLSYSASGSYISPVLDLGECLYAINSISKTESLNGGTTTYSVATSSDGVNFGSFGTPSSSKNRYAKVKIDMTTPNTSNSPSISSASLDYQIADKFLFQDGTDIKKYLSGTNILPNMTANNLPSPYVVSADSGTPWNAFDHNVTTIWQGATIPGWIQIDLGSQQTISEYTIQARDTTGANAPISWTLIGSNDSTTWDTLDTQINVLTWAMGEKRSYLLPSLKTYRYYKIQVTKVANTSIQIAEIELLSPKQWVTIGTAPATKAMFDTNGMTDLSIITNTALQQLVSDTPELLCWTDEVSISNNAIPIMTSNTTPNGIVSASSSPSNGTNLPWYAFNHSNSSGVWSTAINIVAGWLAYDFQINKTIKTYALSCFSSTGYETSMPKNWTFEGTNDGGATWTVLDTQINQTGWTAGKRNVYTISNPGNYSKYRLNVSANNGDALIGLSELEMMEFIPPTRTTNLTSIPVPQLLLPVGDIEVGELENMKVDTATIGDVSTIIATPIMTSDILPSGKSQASSVRATGQEAFRAFNQGDTNSWLSSAVPTISAKQWLSYEFPVEKIIKKYIIRVPDLLTNAPKDWTFEGSNDGFATFDILDTKTSIINFAANIDKEFVVSSINKSYKSYRLNISSINGGTGYVAINELKLYEGIQGNTDIKLLVSGDSGVNWKGKTSVNLSDLTAVKTNGFTPAEFNALTKTELASLFPNGKVRIAYYLEQEKSTDVVQVNSLTINERQYTMTPSVDSLSVLYNVLQSEKPILYVSRDDGVNWKQVQPDQLTKLDDLPNGNQLRVKAILSNGEELHGLSYSWL